MRAVRRSPRETSLRFSKAVCEGVRSGHGTKASEYVVRFKNISSHVDVEATHPVQSEYQFLQGGYVRNGNECSAEKVERKIQWQRTRYVPHRTIAFYCQ